MCVCVCVCVCVREREPRRESLSEKHSHTIHFNIGVVLAPAWRPCFRFLSATATSVPEKNRVCYTVVKLNAVTVKVKEEMRKNGGKVPKKRKTSLRALGDGANFRHPVELKIYKTGRPRSADSPNSEICKTRSLLYAIRAKVRILT